MFRQFPPFKKITKTKLFNARDVYEYIASRMPVKPAAITLSQGMDSVILASMMPKGSTAYTAIFDGKDCNESAEAARFAAMFGLKHRIIKVDWSDYQNTHRLLIRHKGQPLIPIEPTIYRLAMEAKSDGYDTVVTGVGAGSQFGQNAHMHALADNPAEFLKKWAWLNPADILKQPVPLEVLASNYISNGRIEPLPIMTLDRGCNGGDENATRAAGMQWCSPYEGIDLDLDIDRAVNDGKYVLKEIYRERVGEEPYQPIGWNRPIGTWLKKWRPTSPYFKDQLPVLGGNRKWQLYSLETFWNMHQLRDIPYSAIEPYVEAAESEGLIFRKRTEYQGLYVDGELVGFAGILWQGEKATFKSSYILPAERRKGYHELIEDYRYMLAKRRGVKAIEAGCTDMHLPAVLRRGFQITGKTADGIYTKVRLEL